MQSRRGSYPQLQYVTINMPGLQSLQLWLAILYTAVCQSIVSQTRYVMCIINLYYVVCLQPVKKGKGKSKGKAKGKKKAGGKKGKGKKGKGKGKKTAVDKTPVPPPDPLSAAAMLNAYYISHGPVEFLAFRGYAWGGAGGKKKKKGKKGKKQLINLYMYI